MKLKYTTLWLGLICVFVFILQIVFGTEYFLLINELKFTQPWRLLTSMFAHSGGAHLVANLFSLVLFGLILEGRIGAKRILWLFLISGLLINIFSPYSRSLGASGAIFAILGVLIVLRPLMIIWLYGIPLPMFLAGIVWLFIDLFGVFYPSGIANLAHIGGLIIGLVYGVILWKKFGDKWRRKKYSHFDRDADEFDKRYMG